MQRVGNYPKSYPSQSVKNTLIDRIQRKIVLNRLVSVHFKKKTADERVESQIGM